MKFYTLFALFSAAAVAKQTDDADVEAKIKEQLEGGKSFYDGYYKAFYHVNSDDATLSKCMDDKTIGNMIQLGKIV